MPSASGRAQRIGSSMPRRRSTPLQQCTEVGTAMGSAMRWCRSWMRLCALKKSNSEIIRSLFSVEKLKSLKSFKVYLILFNEFYLSFLEL